MIDWFNQLWLKEGTEILRPELAWLPLTVLLSGIAVWSLWDAMKVRRGKMLVADEAALSRMFILTSGIGRTIVSAFAIAGMFVLSMAITDPATVGLIPREEAVVMPIVDISGSMNEMDASAPGEPEQSRISAAVESTDKFVRELPEEFMVGLTVYADMSDVEVLVTPRQDRQAVYDALSQLQANGGTALGEGIVAASTAIENFNAGAGFRADLQPPSVAVLLSDGAWDQGVKPEDAVESAKAIGLSINTISFGRDGTQLDPEAMRWIAESTDGLYFSAEDASQLDAVYDQLRDLIGYEEVLTSIAANYVLVGSITLVLALLMALVVTRSPLPASNQTKTQTEETKWKLTYAA